MKINYIYVTVILFLVITFIMLFVFTDIFKSTDAYHAQCKASVYASTYSVAGKHIFRDADIKCPTRNFDFRGEAKRKIADEMYHCWDNYGRGKYSLFSENNGRYCAICTVFTVNKEQEEFKEFLLTEKYEPTGFSFKKAEKVKYMDFFAAEISEDFNIDYNKFTDASNKVDEAIEKDTEYVVMLYYIKGETAMAEYGRYMKDNVGVITGAGIATGVITVFLIANPVGLTVTAFTVLGAATYTAYSYIESFFTGGSVKPYATHVMLQKFDSETIINNCDNIEVRT